MTYFLALAAAMSAPIPAATATPQSDEDKFRACLHLVDKDPEAAIAMAGQWRVAGSLVMARQCLGMAYAASQRWDSAMTAFEQSAQAAEANKDARAAGLWVQAGNAALAAKDAVKARGYFDAAIILGTLNGPEAGEARLDRARALVATNDLPRARTDLDAALGLVPADPLAWLLSAALARRMGDLVRAQNDIGEAAKRAPDDASIALEAGNIAAMAGQEEAAKTAWQAAQRLQPNGPQGQAAARALAQFAAPAAESSPPKP